ncbi:Probable NAD(P)H-dependent D-xylose reductase xyl1 [Seminavis robusta]|uniref:Probable NAD(P)H-dependent D-xylose reductase xyl1 n=1 Tax=Seminavis robusta TaxID=568900 RepID=A0A9N8HTR2_9STRA|nr:Probable NAD(P)H-dependent D-xylose reductase xyl1 [Seminavis robusta]|eukprot:Sro1304_g261060.1 Probable NAD(P)H-dependent D-xylose reductase xyl1 (511) ;mRNA; r:8536-10068
MRLSSVLVFAVLFLTLPSASGWLWGDKNKNKNKDKECQGDACNNKKNAQQRNNNSGKTTTDDDSIPLTAEGFGLSKVSVGDESGIPMVHLHDDQVMPLVGLGVEYLQPFLVPLMTASALQRDKKTWLFDTAHVTGNEALLANGIQQGLQRMNLLPEEHVELHVITKVWYTHLGYERTKLSVKESYERLQAALTDSSTVQGQVQLKVHMLLQWPRCYETIDWMNCELDEANVGEHVQQAGPPPHQDKDNAWKGSWKALEEIYLAGDASPTPIASIGVANFHLKDLQDMDSQKDLQVHPHMLQVSIWSLLYDPHLVDYCTQRGIHLQIVDSIDGILADPSRARNAHHHLLKVAEDLIEDAAPTLSQDEITPTQVVYTWLVQQGVSIVPGPERLSELQEYSGVTLAAMPQMTHAQVETVAHCMEAFLSGEDLEKDINTFVTFHAKSKDAMLYWQRPDGGENKIAFIARGSSFNESTYPKHHFRIYDARNKDNFIDYHVQAKFGEQVSFDAYLE